MKMLTFKFKLYYFVLLCLLSLCNCIRKTDVCTQINPCKCVYNNGIGINLNDSNVKYETNNTTKIIFHPCSNIAVGHNKTNAFVENDCERTSLCLITTKMINLGTFEDFRFETDSDSGKIYLVSKYNNWNTDIELHCSINEESNLEFKSVDLKEKSLNLIFFSPNACITNNIHKLGSNLWSVIILVLLIILIGYIIGGMIFNFINGAEGIRIVPHYYFWCNVFSRIKNLCFFCVGGCQSSSGYDRI